MGWFEGSTWKWTLAWQRDLLQQELQEVEELSTILTEHHPVLNKEDTLTWKGKKEYKAKVLHQMLCMEMAAEVESIVCSVWMHLAPPKVEFFMWLVLLGKINTKEKLCTKGILPADQTLCALCSAQTETLDHVLLNCPFSWRVWTSVATELGQVLTVQPSFKVFYETWLNVQWRSKRVKKIWLSIVFAGAWRLWMSRNEVIFKQKELNFEELCHSIKWQVSVWTKTWKEEVPYRAEDIVRNFSAIPAMLS